jgi:hypothetical protein
MKESHRILTPEKVKRHINRYLKTLSNNLSPKDFVEILSTYLSEERGTRNLNRPDLRLHDYIHQLRRENKKV